MPRTPFTVEVLTPEGEVFNDEVEMLSTRTSVGSIGILANHQPLLAMLDPTELRLYKSESEVIRYAQQMANPLLTLSLVLRSPDDFIDPETGEPVPPVLAETTGITLQELINTYGVLPPTIFQPVLPSLAP